MIKTDIIAPITWDALPFHRIVQTGERPMPNLEATLFGKFKIEQRGFTFKGIRARKVQELLSYLLIFRNHAQSRELLCETLWAGQPSLNSRKYLRQTLWRLQSAIKTSNSGRELKLHVDNHWIQINVSDKFWLDVEEFEKIFNLVINKKTSELSTRDHKLMEYAARLYKGDLLEGWYLDWCLFERERFQTMHLMLLDKLVQFCELNKKYETGLSYGIEILRHDHAYERTHRQLMRLYFMTGNRTEALHQYDRCVLALGAELGVEPSQRTKQLYEQIRLDKFQPQSFTEKTTVVKTKVRATPVLKDLFHRLEEVSATLRRLEHKIEKEIVGLEDGVSDQS
jgi:DNA-binding SARP family transcriptional activator